MSGAAVGIVSGIYYFSDYDYQRALDLAWEQWSSHMKYPEYEYFGIPEDNSLYGISVKNADGHSIISSDIETPHFAGYADHTGTVLASTNKIENYNPSIISAAEKAQIAQAAVDAVIPAAQADRIALATAAGAAALIASQALDGRTTAGNVTTNQSTSDLGFVTILTITAVTTTVFHPAVTSTDPVTHIVTIITPAYTTTSTSNIEAVYENPVSVIKAAYDASYLASKGAYDVYIEETYTNYLNYVDVHNAAIGPAIAFNKIGSSHIHTFKTPGVEDYSPLFFINPTNQTDSYGVLRQYYTSGFWKLDVIQSGDNARAPNILVFKRAKDLPLPTSNENGIVTYLKDGTTIAFDSRRKPLAILSSIQSTSPSIPMNGGVAPVNSENYTVDYYNIKLDFNFRCDNQKKYTDLNAIIAPNNVMFCVPALAQAVYSRTIRGSKISPGGWFEADQKIRKTDNWWVMYHQTYSVSGSNFAAGWCVYKSGYMYITQNDKGGASWGSVLGSLAGFVTFGLTGVVIGKFLDLLISKKGQTVIVGQAPYKNKTVNLLNNNVLISDASLYR